MSRLNEFQPGEFVWYEGEEEFNDPRLCYVIGTGSKVPGPIAGINRQGWKGCSETDPDRVWVISERNPEGIHVVGPGSDLCLSGIPVQEKLKTAKQMEEELYRCSYCGEEGHNRRTCPESISKGKAGKMEVKSSIAKGDIVRILDVEDRFKIFRDHKNYVVFYGKEFEVINVTDDDVITKPVTIYGENIEGAGDNLPFRKDIWAFELVGQDDEYRQEVKKLTIWQLTEAVLPHSRLTLLYGPPGTGKTTAGNFAGNPEKVCNITLTEETPAAELRGHFVPKGGNFVWMDGPALTAFKKGYRLVLNEIDKASGDALTFCHALLDDPGIAAITLPYDDEDGEPVTVYPHENFHVIATMNGEPDDLPEALNDRFAIRLHIDKLHPKAIKALPKDLRKAASKGVSGDAGRSISVRGWKAFDSLRTIEDIGENAAAKAVFGERAETILNTIRIERSKLGEKK
jgi:Holliday junction resolvasome RuvABC ATP-dependent DNA helicase subunit